MGDAVKSRDASNLLAEVRVGTAGDPLGVAAGIPLLIVDTDDADLLVDLTPPALWRCVIVATSSATFPPAPPPGADIYISAAPEPPAPWVHRFQDETDGLDAVTSRVASRPQAATTLMQVLRVGAALGPQEALVVESLAYSSLQAGSEHLAWLGDRPVRQPPLPGRPAVLIERSGPSLDITFDTPERHNAYGALARDQLIEALRLAAADETIETVRLRGNGPSFCSGGDLTEFGSVSDPATAHGIRTTRSPAAWLNILSPRIETYLHGSCIGAGIELAAFAGTVYADIDTTISLPEVGMGLLPGAGGTVSIPARIGAPRTAWLATTGMSLRATTAHSWGLVDRITGSPTGSPHEDPP